MPKTAQGPWSRRPWSRRPRPLWRRPATTTATKEVVSLYRTSNQAYGSRAPTVHEMPKVFYPCSTKFSRQILACGVFQDSSFNVCMEKSLVTGPDNYVTHCDRLNFHPSYNVSKPSICD
ncbi:piercer of microtubule wall 1 protein isoform X2 [Sciurus carolinensis]|uniref:piercer of microtubule wall 1 protein isoform X2 n=1 Tax=Sciurus carolinensis TaxID=30640 RepID=UPI001FB46A02|nr:piercer of microtubule wall 1 protein isoform X2 [Sciurus carolinensis]